ncbi:MAG: hypothetical protein JSS12_07805 [Verrucomicrobia bacterium]|nr:hypothetical protein [Verrucomicrobiota bacterium]
MEPTSLSHQDIDAWGLRISEEIARKSQEFVGNESLRVQTDSHIGEKIKEFALGLLKDFPRGSVGWFIQATFTVIPHIVIKYEDLKPILQEDPLGGLFAHEIGKTATITNLFSEIFGNFIDQPTKLDLLDIKIPEKFHLEPNQWTEEKVKEEAKTSCLNASRTVGVVDIDPNLETAKMTATVRFGATEIPNQTLTLKTRDRQNSTLVIPLYHLSMSAKIRYDGEVSLPNGKTFTMSDILPPQNLAVINSPFNFNINFNVDFSRSSDGAKPE